ncbi:hypothetical protein Agub_g1827, partial [Astrephomene gubernaculifera]
MEGTTLEETTDRLRSLLRQKVPELLLQAECGGGLELPSPLPWGFASVPSLYELADTAEKELYDMQQMYDSRRRRGGGGGGGSCREEEQQPVQQAEEQPGQQQPLEQEEQRQQQPEAFSGQGGGEAGDMPGEVASSPQAAGEPPPVAVVAGDGEAGIAAETAEGGSLAGGEGIRVEGTEGQQRDAAASLEGGGGAAPAGRGAAGSGGNEGGGAGGKAEGAGGGEGPGPEAAPEGGDDAEGAAEDRTLEAAGTSPHEGRSCLQGSQPCPDANALLPDEPPRRPYACTAFYDSLLQSRTYRSPHCEGAMVEALGLGELYEGLAGSGLRPPPAREQLEALRGLLRGHINARWALEAVKQGVAAAKQGNYTEAHKCYSRALELDPGNAEAYVARGAAHANQRSFQEAERDLRHALDLDPGHRNAANYLDAVLRHVDEQQQQQQRRQQEEETLAAAA